MKTNQVTKKSKIRRGDSVRILLGKDKGKVAQVMAVLPREGRIMIEGVNMVKKHVRPKRAGEKGQRVSIASPLDISNAQIVCPSCKKGTRIGIKVEGGEHLRQCKKCQATLPTKLT